MWNKKRRGHSDWECELLLNQWVIFLNGHLYNLLFKIFYSSTKNVEKRWMDSYNFFMQMGVRCLMLSKFFISAFYVVGADGKWWSVIIVGCRIKLRRTLSWLEVKFKSFYKTWSIKIVIWLDSKLLAGVGHSYLLCNESNLCKQCLNSHSIPFESFVPNHFYVRPIDRPVSIQYSSWCRCYIVIIPKCLPFIHSFIF